MSSALHTEDIAIRSTTSSDTVRSPNVDEVVTQKELTTYVEDEHLLEAIQPGTLEQSLHLLNSPFPSQDLGTVLSRSYEIVTLTWSAVSSGRLAELDFPGELFNKPQISQLLDYFSFFRCKAVRLGIRINSTVWHYGTLILTQMPHVINGTNDPQSSVECARNNKPFLLSAMTAGVVEVDFEWQIPVDWIDLDSSARTGTHIGEMCRAYLDVLVPLRQVGQASAQSVDITVFASFIEPELSGMNPDFLLPQGKVKNTETKEKTEDHTLLSEASDWISGAVDMVSGLGDAIGKLAPLAALLDKPTTLEVITKTRQDLGNELSQGAGADPSNKLSLMPDANISSGGHFMGPMDPSAPLLECFMRPGWLHTFSFTSNNLAGTLLYDLPVTPTEVHSTGVFPVRVFYPHYLAWFSSQFKYWRGGIRYLFYFTASSMTSCRIRITYFPGGTRAYAVGNYSGDVISRVVDISGDTHTAIDIPYIADRTYKQVKPISEESTAYDTVGYLGIELVNQVAMSDPSQVATITANIWVAAAPDFQVNQFDADAFGSDSSVEYSYDFVAQSHVGDLMDSATPIIAFDRGTEARLVSPEEYRCVTDLLKRYTDLDTYNILPSPTTTRIYAVPTVTSVNMSHLAWLRIPFRWSRGGYRYRVYVTDTSTIREAHWYRAGPAALHPFSAGAVLQHGPNGLVMALETPYYEALPFVENNTRMEYYSSQLIELNVGTTEIAGEILVSVADDFGLGGLWSPPVLKQALVPLTSTLKSKKKKYTSPAKL